MKTATPATHSPAPQFLPWRVCDSHFEGPRHLNTICDSRNVVIQGGIDRHEATHIVRCVNSHAELVAALEAFEQGRPDGDNTARWFAQYAVNLQHARAAIQRAMSAYIVEKAHVLYLVNAAMSRRLSHCQSSFSYYHNGERHELPAGDYQAAAECAMMLWQENIISVGTRYPKGSSADLPGPISEDYTITAGDMTGSLSPEPAQIFKSIDCYSYQSCEHDGWKDSAAFAFCEALRKAACRSVVGYEEAEWGAPKPKARRCA